jgi:hypothetical protein
LVTEYEALLSKMIEEKKAKLAELLAQGKDRDAAALEPDIKFLEVELARYGEAMTLFRTKGVPKVGRWGKPEVEESSHEAAP